MDDGTWTSVTLRILSGTVSPGAITKQLGSPSSQYEKGEPISHRGGGRRAEGAWLLTREGKPNEDAGAVLRWAVSFIEERRDAVFTLSGACQIDLICGFAAEEGQAGFVLDHQLLERIARFPINLVIDLYPPTASF